ncbi:MAG: hypothetical protein K2L67_06605 [Clostridia bacterium]|nr:hypothetical protein [Clostridia bacterium]
MALSLSVRGSNSGFGYYYRCRHCIIINSSENFCLRHFFVDDLLFDGINIKEYKKLQKSGITQNSGSAEQNNKASKGILSRLKRLILRYYHGVDKYMVNKDGVM